jgi:hypothetical protein
MFLDQGTATTVRAALIAIPLLTELASRNHGFCYMHDAPNVKAVYPPCPRTPHKPSRCLRIRARRIHCFYVGNHHSAQ